MKKFLNIFFVAFLLFFAFSPVQAKDKVNLYFFYGDGCPHCAKEEQFLEKLEKEHGGIKIYYFEVYNNSENRDLFVKVGQELGIDTTGVPLLIVGEKHFVGYYNDETSGGKIHAAVEEYINKGCVDLAGPIFGIEVELLEPGETGDQQAECGQEEGVPEKISLPFIGEVNPRNFSLPVLTIFMAMIDGFNPCAMWVLLFLISLLLGMKDRFKMWTLGSTFVISSAAVYFVFLAAWLNIVLFMGMLPWIKALIAFVALGSGGYHLYDYYTNREGTCKVTGNEKRKATFDKLRQVVLERNFFLSLVGIIVLAAAVNLVELLCSAGIPAVYVPILTLSDLPTWQYYAYLLLYIFVFMLDDLTLFVVAMLTLQMKAFGSRYTRWTGLVGGVALVIIGLLLLFKPEILMFG